MRRVYNACGIKVVDRHQNLFRENQKMTILGLICFLLVATLATVAVFNNKPPATRAEAKVEAIIKPTSEPIGYWPEIGEKALYRTRKAKWLVGRVISNNNGYQIRNRHGHVFTKSAFELRRRPPTQQVMETAIAA